MVLKAERERVKALLTEAITVLCKNGLGYKYTCAIEGLLGITLDDEDVFLVNINETIQKAERPAPVEELAKQETGTASPASSSPSGTPRRRRRHSQEGEAQHSPAKRANYGTGEQEQQQPASKEDVIVIKEEVSETEFTDFYGDTGGGNNDDGGQYAMQQGDQQYPGAGCSQWDTSQTQGGQSDWPAFNPTQQQQAAISQAASSAMMSPSQMSPTALYFGHPSSRLYSSSIKDVFTQHLIKPVLSHNMRVIAFRMNWPRQSLEGTMNTWKDIVHLRTGIDQLVANIPITTFFVSAVCASHTTMTNQKTKSDYKIVPSVSYWMVTTDHHFDMKQLFTSMQSNHYGAALKLQLQPYQQSEEHLSNALFLGVKDNVEGCVRQLIDMSSQHLYAGGGGVQEPIVKVVVKDPQYRDMIRHLVNRLDAVQFNVQLIEDYTH